MGSPACSLTQVVDVAAGVGNERVFTGQPFYPSSRPCGPRRPAGGGGGVGAGALGLLQLRLLPPLPTCPPAFEAGSTFKASGLTG